MAYTPTNWKTGDVITAEKLNNMESGIADCDTAISALKEDLPYITVNGTALVINTGVVDGNEVKF